MTTIRADEVATREDESKTLSQPSQPTRCTHRRGHCEELDQAHFFIEQQNVFSRMLKFDSRRSPTQVGYAEASMSARMIHKTASADSECFVSTRPAEKFSSLLEDNQSVSPPHGRPALGEERMGVAADKLSLSIAMNNARLFREKMAVTAPSNDTSICGSPRSPRSPKSSKTRRA
ncbi:MAG: hypothetical protein JWP59_4767 [Massilia sp.]|nr:hypothetical protein [Massilia sp.]